MPPTPSRKEREADLARQSFIDAAVSVFSRKGFHGATMDEIARSAGYSPGAIYRYFPSKDDVFRAVVARLGEQFIEQADDEPPVALPFAERLRWFIIRHLETALTHRDFFVTFIARNPVVEWDRTSEIGADACEFHDRFIARLSTLMALGVDEGVLAPGDTGEYARVLLALIRSLAGEWLMTAATPDAPVADRADRVVDVLLHGLAAPPRSAS